MNARSIAILLPLFVLPLPTHAVTTNNAPAKKQVVVKSKINLNHASLSTLTGSFKGIGKKRAEAIIAYRDSHHGFKSLEELADVKGFGQHFLEKNRGELNEIFSID